MRLQVQKLWNLKAIAIPVVVGAFGTVSEELENRLKTVKISIVISCLQKAALLATAFILRKVLGIEWVTLRCQGILSSDKVVMLYQKKLIIMIIILIIIIGHKKCPFFLKVFPLLPFPSGQIGFCVFYFFVLSLFMSYRIRSANMLTV